MTSADLTFLTDPPRFLFFTGKGGVGKTSIACAAALALVSGGKRVLLVSTDPASNVGQVFGVTIGNAITPIPLCPGCRPGDRPRGRRRGLPRTHRRSGPGPLPEAEIASITEQLSGSCTTEVASFDEFTALLTDTEGTVAGFDHVLFDTAPTGHTIRLLQLPGNWTEFLEAGKGDASCLGPLAGLDKQKSTYAAAVAALAAPDRTRLVLVSRPTRSALREIDRTHAELAALGMNHQYVVVNAVMPKPADDTDPLATAVYRREQAALTDCPPRCTSCRLTTSTSKPTTWSASTPCTPSSTPPRSPGPPMPLPPRRMPWQWHRYASWLTTSSAAARDW